MTVIRTDSKNKDFIDLVAKLDAYLKVTDGDEHDFYNQFNSIEALEHVVVIHKKGIPVACGAFRPLNEDTVEVKRMFTLPEYRGEGLAQSVIYELELWAKEIDYTSCVLETGKRQVEAVRFYQKNGYHQTANYGQYEGVDNSLCFKKSLL